MLKTKWSRVLSFFPDSKKKNCLVWSQMYFDIWLLIYRKLRFKQQVFWSLTCKSYFKHSRNKFAIRSTSWTFKRYRSIVYKYWTVIWPPYYIPVPSKENHNSVTPLLSLQVSLTSRVISPYDQIKKKRPHNTQSKNIYERTISMDDSGIGEEADYYDHCYCDYYDHCYCDEYDKYYEWDDQPQSPDIYHYDPEPSRESTYYLAWAYRHGDSVY